MSKPKRKDAQLILQMAHLGQAMGIGDANPIIFAPGDPPTPEQYPLSTDQGQAILQAMRWFETIGTIYRNGAVNEDLLFDWLAISAFWDRLKAFALSNRESTGIPAMWENFEYMAERQRGWTPRRD